MSRTSFFIAGALLAVSLGAGTATVGFASNPVDKVSNPSGWDYTNVGISPQNMGAPFVRDGIVNDPRLFSAIKAGLTQAEVSALLGAPLRKAGSRESEWDYNFRFRMEQSQNFLVCQYKVVFDERQLLRDAVWRRQQCQRLVGGSRTN